MYVPPQPLHSWGVELQSQTRGVSTRLGTTLWGEGQEGTRTFQEVPGQSGELPRSLTGTEVLDSCVNRHTSRKMRTPSWTPEMRLFFQGGGNVSPSLPQMLPWIWDNRLFAWWSVHLCHQNASSLRAGPVSALADSRPHFQCHGPCTQQALNKCWVGEHVTSRKH